MQPIRDGGIPEFLILVGPLGPRAFIGGSEAGCPKQSDSLVERSRARRESLLRGVRVEEDDVLIGQTHADFHTLILLKVCTLEDISGSPAKQVPSGSDVQDR